MKVFLTLTMLWCSVSLMAQQSAGLLFGGAAGLRETVTNIVAGPATVWAYYPDAEFLLNSQKSTLHITVIGEDGESVDQCLRAVVGLVADKVYRADIDADTWVQVDLNTGITCVYQNCVLRIFKPACKC